MHKVLSRRISLFGEDNWENWPVTGKLTALIAFAVEFLMSSEVVDVVELSYMAFGTRIS